MTDDEWNDPSVRKAWFGGGRRERKRRPLWIALGFFSRELIIFAYWMLFRT